MSDKIETTERGEIKFSIDLYDAIHRSLDDVGRIRLVESLACADNVVMDVVDCLTDSYTSHGFRPSDSTMRVAKQAIALHAEKIAAEVIADLEQQRDDFEKKYLSYLSSSATYSRQSDHYKALYYQALEQLKIVNASP